MKRLISKELFKEPLVLGAIGLAIVIALGAVVYYIEGSQTPAVSVSLSSMATSTAQGQGTVEPAENGTLAFQSGGQVVQVPAVGEKVYAGQEIASLDTATLSAQLEQARANLAQAQANLAGLEAPPRAVDIAPKETAVSQAQATLMSDYAAAQQALADAYSATYQALHADTDSLIENPDPASASLNFETKSNQSETNALSARTSADSALTAWQSEVNNLSASSTTAQIDNAGNDALTYLDALRDFSNAMTTALADAIPTTSFPASSITAANTAVGELSATVEQQIEALQADQQKLTADTLAVQSAEDALSQAMASSTPETIEAAQAAVQAAQADVNADDAQLSNAIIVAPFAGVVSSVQVKAGDIATAGNAAVVVTPNTALQVLAYFSEVDAAMLQSGMAADVTLDAYGENRHFPATVVSVDRSPTMLNSSSGQAGVPAYEVIVQFNENDSAIAVGMSANVTVNAQ